MRERVMGALHCYTKNFSLEVLAQELRMQDTHTLLLGFSILNVINQIF